MSDLTLNADLPAAEFGGHPPSFNALVRGRAWIQIRGSVVAFFGFVFLGLTSAHANACTLNGPRYALTADTVRWSLGITSGEGCTRGVRLNAVMLRELTV